jgi:hypothetical protein
MPRLAPLTLVFAVTLTLGCGDEGAAPADASRTAVDAGGRGVDAAVVVVDAAGSGADAAHPGVDAPVVDSARADAVTDALWGDMAGSVQEAGARDASTDADACATAMFGARCTMEGRYCGGENCAAACGFCNILSCSGGTWRRVEVPPPPPGQRCEAGAAAGG